MGKSSNRTTHESDTRHVPVCANSIQLGESNVDEYPWASCVNSIRRVGPAEVEADPLAVPESVKKHYLRDGTALVNRRTGLVEIIDRGDVLTSVGSAWATPSAETARRGKGRKEKIYFCALCDQLTQRMVNLIGPSGATTGSSRYCDDHIPPRFTKGEARQFGSNYERDKPKQDKFQDIYRTILLWMNDLPEYRNRFLVDADFAAEPTKWWECLHDSDDPDECGDLDLELSEKNLPSAMAFHANVRKVAHEIALRSPYDAKAFLILEELLQGATLEKASRVMPQALNSKKRLGQHNGLAVAWMICNGMKPPEIAARFGVSSDAVRDRADALRGSFNFSWPPELIWWPFGGLGNGPNVVTFSTTPNWHHTEKEYRHLADALGNPAPRHRRAASSSSLPTRSSARK